MRCYPHRPVGRGSVAAGVERPTRGRAGHPWSPYLALLQVGFGRRCVAARGRALLPPDFTLAGLPKTGRRYVSVPLSVPGPVSRAGAWALPSTPSGGARTFLPETRGLAAATRPVRLSPDARLAWACRRVKQTRAQPARLADRLSHPASPNGKTVPHMYNGARHIYKLSTLSRGDRHG